MTTNNHNPHEPPIGTEPSRSRKELVKKVGDGLGPRILRAIGFEKAESYREYGAGFSGDNGAKSSRSRPVQLFFHKLKVGWWVAAGLASLVLLGAIPMDIRIPRPESADEDHPKYDALFSHTSHSSFKCYSCHPSIFPTAKVAFTHDDMDDGLYCGSCHNDRTAFSPDAPGVSCTTCHQKD